MDRIDDTADAMEYALHAISTQTKPLLARYKTPDRRASARTGRVLVGCEPAAGVPMNRQQWRKLAAALRAKGVTNATELKNAAEGLDKQSKKP